MDPMGYDLLYVHNHRPKKKILPPFPAPASSSWFKAPIPRREGKVAARLPRSESHDGFEAPVGVQRFSSGSTGILMGFTGILMGFHGILMGFNGIYWDLSEISWDL